MSTSKEINDEDIELALHCSEICLSEATITQLLNKKSSGTKKFTPNQIRHVLAPYKAEQLLNSFLHEPLSSAEALLADFDTLIKDEGEEAQKNHDMLIALKEEVQTLKQKEIAAAEEVQTLKQEVKKKEIAAAEELQALKLEMNELKASPTNGFMATTAPRTTNKSFSTLMRNFNGGDLLDEDTFTLMMLSKPRSKSWILGLAAFWFQITLSFLIAFDQIKESSDSSIFNVPFKVTSVVRFGQFLAIIVCLLTQSDVLSSIQVLVLLGKDTNWNAVIGVPRDEQKTTTLWMTRIVLPNILKLFQGLLVLFVCFVIIVQSDNIIELLKEFTALLVLSEADNVMFSLAGRGYLGEHLRIKTLDAKEIEIKDANAAGYQNKRRGYYVRSLVLILLLIGMLTGWGVIAATQTSGYIFYKKYPDCDGGYELAKEHFGDGKCYGGILNTLGCSFEGGDCVNFNLAYPLCKGDNLINVEDSVGNGECDAAFSILECDFDGSDCCPDNISKSPLYGDGQCDGGLFNSKSCGYDNGDCNNFNRAYPECPLEDLASMSEGSTDIVLGDGICDSGIYSIETCGFENGDCDRGQVGQDLDFIFDVMKYKYDIKLDVIDGIDMNLDGTRMAIAGKFFACNNKSMEPCLEQFEGAAIARVYDYDSSRKVWTQLGHDILAEEASLGRNSRSIALSSNGNRVAVGDPWIGDGGFLSFGGIGRVRVFDFDQTSDTWIQVGNNIDGEADKDDNFGWNIDMTADGSRLAISAPGRSYPHDNLFLGTYRKSDGYIRVYELSNSTDQIWEQVGEDILAGTVISLQLSTDGNILIFNDEYYDKDDYYGLRFTNSTINIYEYNPSTTGTTNWNLLGTSLNAGGPMEVTTTACTISSYGSEHIPRLAFSSREGGELGIQDSHFYVSVYDFNRSTNTWNPVPVVGAVR